MTAKRFHIGDLLSVTDGRLVSPNHMSGLYNVIDFVTGQAHTTHQLPCAMKVVGPWVLKQHPWLAGVEFDFEIPAGATSDEAMMVILGWVEGVAARYGEYHEVEPMPSGKAEG